MTGEQILAFIGGVVLMGLFTYVALRVIFEVVLQMQSWGWFS